MYHDDINRDDKKPDPSHKTKHFLGINFVEPFTKSHRWQRLQTVPTVYQSHQERGAIAPQLPSTNDLLMANGEDLRQHEDCLNLNIFSADVTAKLPVMVWIHGGGFTIGSGSLPTYNGEKLAKDQNVVVVSINYRLGSLGFLRLCDVTEGVIDSTGNEGLFDQISALQWIQKHIHHFGGDNANVTVFGESAGAMSIACLLAMPQAKGLFHKAILQSGAGHSYHSKERANELGKYFLEVAMRLGHSVEQLADLPTHDLLAIQQHMLATPEIYKKFGVLPFKPVIDEEHLLLAPHDAIAQGCAKDITIIAGTNDDEWTLFAQIINQNIDSIEQLTYALSPLLTAQDITQCLELMTQQIRQRNLTVNAQNLLNETLSNYWFHQPCHRLLAAQANAGGQAFGYKFGRKTVVETLGSTHITEIGYVFACTDRNFHGESARVKELTQEIQQYWGYIAHHQPNNTTLISWPKYRPANSQKQRSVGQFQYLYFNHDASYVDIIDQNLTAFWANISDLKLSLF